MFKGKNYLLLIFLSVFCLLTTGMSSACEDGRFHGSYDPILNRPKKLPEGVRVITPKILDLVDREFSYQVVIESDGVIEGLAIKIAPGPGVIVNKESFGVFEDTMSHTVTAKSVANVMTMTSVQIRGRYNGQEFNAYRFVTALPKK
ncbi:hypothetical protein [Agarivorans sp. Alg241-V36]|uniref:hypothetical protein n=1 Tax=Agarivorans sp. Alg241-V36 TaxID=2305992 RepID=UPI0013D575C6|nr:hypothetical protein [Agarivorans sp. Alg241-V36]